MGPPGLERRKEKTRRCNNAPEIPTISERAKICMPAHSANLGTDRGGNMPKLWYTRYLRTVAPEKMGPEWTPQKC